MKISKSIVLSLAACLSFNSVAFAQNSDQKSADKISAVCRGEFSDKIIESIGQCSLEDLSKSLADAKLALADFSATRKKLIAIQQGSKSGINGSQRALIMLSSCFVTAVGLAGGAATLSTLAKFGIPEGSGSFYKATGYGSLATFIIGLAGLYASVDSSQVEVETKDLPNLISYTSVAEKDLNSRIISLEMAIKLKNEISIQK